MYFIPFGILHSISENLTAASEITKRAQLLSNLWELGHCLGGVPRVKPCVKPGCGFRCLAHRSSSISRLQMDEGLAVPS